MSQRQSCPACLKPDLTQSGYHFHLRQSHDPHCTALYQELMGSSLHSNDNIDSDTGNPDELVAFNGDAFSGPDDYVDDDFGQDALAQEPPVQEDEGDNFDEQEEDLEAAQAANLETSWEPEHPDWEIAKWAKLQGAGSIAFLDLLAIGRVCEALGLSYKSSNQLNKIIDERLPGHPAFHCHEVIVAGKAFKFFSHNVIECLTVLWGDIDFAEHLIVEPECHYVDTNQMIHHFFDMQTGKWWWCTQEELEAQTGEKNCTIVPVLISSDKTQLTVFCGKTTYLVYMTIGNLPKDIQ
ncbi:hypothetical protein F5148DRAFT_1288224 [Russula earlei]|uniref:Uncharacterized protein n=1 Tax=Russula earlei TaxID=71964 RepID=A0ACC0U0C1_9AGAM|nr:hypothetical protein F5148DRAFT_1288224 [Russula earlei]